MFELPLSEMLHPPNGSPLSVAIDDLMTAKFDYGAGTAVTVVGILGTLFVIAILVTSFKLFAPRSWKRVRIR